MCEVLTNISSIHSSASSDLTASSHCHQHHHFLSHVSGNSYNYALGLYIYHNVSLVLSFHCLKLFFQHNLLFRHALDP